MTSTKHGNAWDGKRGGGEALTGPGWEPARAALGAPLHPASEAEGRRQNAVLRRAVMWTPILSSPNMDRGLWADSASVSGFRCAVLMGSDVHRPAG